MGLNDSSPKCHAISYYRSEFTEIVLREDAGCVSLEVGDFTMKLLAPEALELSNQLYALAKLVDSDVVQF